jgi:hypothetical protein
MLFTFLSQGTIYKYNTLSFPRGQQITAEKTALSAINNTLSRLRGEFLVESLHLWFVNFEWTLCRDVGLGAVIFVMMEERFIWAYFRYSRIEKGRGAMLGGKKRGRIFASWVVVALVLIGLLLGGVKLFSWIGHDNALISQWESRLAGWLHRQRVEQQSELLLQQDLKAQETQRLVTDLAARAQRYSHAMRAHHEAFLEALPPVEATDAFEKAHEGVAFIASAKGLCGWQVCLSLAYKMAYDQVKGTSRVEEAIAPVVAQHLEAPLASALAAYTELVAHYQERMLAETVAFQTDCALRMAEFETFLQGLTLLNEGEIAQVGAALEALRADIREIALTKTSVVIGAAVEAVFLKSTCTLVRRVLAGVSARLVRSAGSATVASVVDGPLPIGDVVGGILLVGGLAWSASDLLQAMIILPAELRQEVGAAIDAYQLELVRNAKTQMADYCSALEASACAEYAKMVAIVEATK